MDAAARAVPAGERARNGVGMKAYRPADNGIYWWRDIPGYGGRYQASRVGGIRRRYESDLVRDMTPFRKSGTRNQKIFRNRLYVKLTLDGISGEVAVLKIMAETWIGQSPPGYVPYHKNGIVTDNRADNIGYIAKHELGVRTGYKSRSQSVFKVNEYGEVVEVYRSAREAARCNHMSYQTVMDRCNGKIKKPYALDGHTYSWEDGRAGRPKRG